MGEATVEVGVGVFGVLGEGLVEVEEGVFPAAFLDGLFAFSGADDPAQAAEFVEDSHGGCSLTEGGGPAPWRAIMRGCLYREGWERVRGGGGRGVWGGGRSRPWLR